MILPCWPVLAVVALVANDRTKWSAPLPSDAGLLTRLGGYTLDS